MQRTAPVVALVAIVVLGLSPAGCGPDGPELAPVAGTVTLDGNPLAGARIEFQPQEGENASPSYGMTDQAGRYKLIYGPGQKGAMLGRHAVRISTGGQSSDGVNPAMEIPERVPPRYNSETELFREVESGGNTIDFKLEGVP